MTEHYQLTSEQKILKETVGRMAQEKIGPYAAEIDETGEFPWDVHDGGLYHLLGVEFFESGPGDAWLVGATVFDQEPDDPCGRDGGE